MLMLPPGMGTGLLSVIRGIAGMLGVTLSSTFLEHQRTTLAIYLTQQREMEDEQERQEERKHYGSYSQIWAHAL